MLPALEVQLRQDRKMASEAKNMVKLDILMGCPMIQLGFSGALKRTELLDKLLTGL